MSIGRKKLRALVRRFLTFSLDCLMHVVLTVCRGKVKVYVAVDRGPGFASSVPSGDVRPDLSMALSTWQQEQDLGRRGVRNGDHSKRCCCR
jgi:hypothetical protein